MTKTFKINSETVGYSKAKHLFEKYDLDVDTHYKNFTDRATKAEADEFYELYPSCRPDVNIQDTLDEMMKALGQPPLEW